MGLISGSDKSLGCKRGITMSLRRTSREATVRCIQGCKKTESVGGLDESSALGMRGNGCRV